MKNKILSLLYTTAATLVLLTISSCSGIFSVPDTPDEQGTKAAQEQRYTISGSFSMPNASAAPAEVNSFQNQANPRNAMPETSGLTYIVKAVNPGGHEESTISTDHKTYYLDNLTAGNWQITAYATNQSTGVTVMRSETESVSISAESPYASANLTMAPESGSGSINLSVNWNSDSGIGYCKWSLSGLGLPTGNGTSGPITIQAPNVSSGTYQLALNFYTSESYCTAGAKPLYSCTEYVAVYPSLTTSQWTNGSAPHLTSGFNVTKQCVETFVYRRIYVSQTGNDTTGTGTSERPFATIKKAMDRLNEVATLNATKESISATTPWELHVIGTPAKPTDTVSGEGLINATSSIQHLKIVGEGDGATIDANTKGRVLYVQSGANVTVENITLKNGRVSNGGSGAGIYVDTSGTFKMTSGELSGCTSTASAGGIYNKGTLTIENGTISGNSSTSQGGGIFADSGSLTISGGTISGNSTSSYGGGIYVNTGSVTITGGTIRSNTASDGANNVFISTSISATIPAGNDSFYNEYSTANGKADAVCLSGSNFVRFNQPNDSGNSLSSFSNLFTGSATIYLGQTDASSSEWKTSNLEIGADCNYNLTIRPTQTGASATIKYGSDTQSTDYLIHYNKNSKTLTLTNLILDGNSKKCGIVKLDAGTLSASNCTFQNGQAENGGGLHVKAGASATLTSCTIDSCRAENSGSNNSEGGGIFTRGIVNFSGTITNCTVKGNGGGVMVETTANAKFTMTSGTIQSCNAEKVSSTLGGKGGGVWAYQNFTMQGGTITGCTSEKEGAGVYLGSASSSTPVLNMSGNARIDAANEVYICPGWNINITSNLTNTSLPVATITPYQYAGNPQVLTESSSNLIKNNYKKFALSDQTTYFVGMNGKVQKEELITAASSSTGTEIYDLLQEYDKVKIDIPSGVTYSIVPDDSYPDSTSSKKMALIIPSGKTLTCTGGGTFNNAQRCGDVIQVDGGTFNLTGSVTITTQPKGNFWGVVEIKNSGTFNMSGGTITGCNSGSGNGVVSINYGCTFNMTGGSITNNRAAYGAVFISSSGGQFTMDGGSITNNHPYGVYIYKGTFTKNSGTLSGNTAASGGALQNIKIADGGGTYNGTTYNSAQIINP